MSKAHEFEHGAKPAEKAAEKPVEKPVEKPAPSHAAPSHDLAALRAENAALKAKLAAYEPPPAPKVEYPKWIYTRNADGQITSQTLVADAAAEARHAKGQK